MKSWLPHLIYCGLLLGGGWLIWWNTHLANQRIAFLNRPTKEAYTMLLKDNRTLQKSIKRIAMSYRTSLNQQLMERARQADSLVSLAAAHTLHQDSLRLQLRRLTDLDPQTGKLLSETFPPEKLTDRWPVYQSLRQQQDSLRQQIGLWTASRYFSARIGGYDSGCYAYAPGVSFTTLFPTVHDTFQADVAFTGYAQLEIISIGTNGKLLPVKDGVGAFHRTFATTGVYPLEVEAKYLDLIRDTMLTTKKTFYLHVNR